MTTRRIPQNFLHWRIFAASIALAGCATPVPNAMNINTAGREPVCVRSCLAVYSDCVSRAPTGEVVNVRTMYACYSSAEACVRTCPAQ